MFEISNENLTWPRESIEDEVCTDPILTEQKKKRVYEDVDS